jgi:hypothetical protein
MNELPLKKAALAAIVASGGCARHAIDRNQQGGGDLNYVRSRR